LNSDKRGGGLSSAYLVLYAFPRRQSKASILEGKVRMGGFILVLAFGSICEDGKEGEQEEKISCRGGCVLPTGWESARKD